MRWHFRLALVCFIITVICFEAHSQLGIEPNPTDVASQPHISPILPPATLAEIVLEDASENLLVKTDRNINAITANLDSMLDAFFTGSHGEGNVEMVLKAAYAVVVDCYVKAFQIGVDSLEILQSIGVQQLKVENPSPSKIPRGFQDGGSGTWDAHRRAVSELLHEAFLQMALSTEQFARNFEALNAEFGLHLRINLKNSIPSLDTTIGPTLGFTTPIIDDPGAELQLLSVWTASSTADMAPVGLGGGIAEKGNGPVRVTLRGSGSVPITREQIVPVKENGRFSFLFDDLLAPGIYRFDVSYVNGYSGSDRIVIFMATAENDLYLRSDGWLMDGHGISPQQGLEK